MKNTLSYSILLLSSVLLFQVSTLKAKIASIDTSVQWLTDFKSVGVQTTSPATFIEQ